MLLYNRIFGSQITYKGIKLLIEFVKMHGLGNDFVIVKRTSNFAEVNEQKLAIAMSNRRTGVGCDQFIIYEEPSSLELSKIYNMSIYNRDGSSAEACGNGTRCLVQLIGKENVQIKVLNRMLQAKILSDGNVSVNMGEVSFNKPWMPNKEILWSLASQYKLEPKEIICVDIGNPHLIIFNSDLAGQDIALLGSMLERHEVFPYGVNVNFAKILGKDIELKVWERGDGFTLACGSGACATFAAAKKLGFVNDEANVSFELGSLNMKMEKDGSVLMNGPATIVARGSYLYE